MTRRTAVAAMLAATAFASARAGTLSMQVTCTTEAKTLLVSLVNKGTETAHHVTVQAEVAGVTNHMAGGAPALNPDRPFDTRFPLPVFEKAGSYPAVVTVGFADANGHPFSSVTVHPVTVGSPEPSRLFAVLESRSVRQEGRLMLRLRNESNAPLAVAGRAVAARELIVDLPPDDLRVPPRGVLDVPVRIDNFSAMPASTYPVYVILEHDLPGQHACTVASGTVQMLPALPLTSGLFWGITMLVVLGIGIAIAAQFRRRARKP